MGLPPAQPAPQPWWEQRQTPWWEQKRVPSWEQKQVPVWEQKNPARVILDQERDARRLARTPQSHHRSQPPIVYALPPYRYFAPNPTLSYGVMPPTTYPAPAPPMTVAPAPPPAGEAVGWLRLEVEPRDTLQIFVDGLFVGTPDDLGDEFELRPGPRRIELRAPGYRTLVFDTPIVADRTTVYRGVLERAPATPVPVPGASSPSSAPASKAPIYFIPGCYMGNVAPTAAILRPGCDISKVITSGK
ncbi:MAG: hypothetical protein K2Y23_12770 [Cyanobacteria bacterium]|nr:hypothetical protein [Cyanobacteriota bacterium]